MAAAAAGVRPPRPADWGRQVELYVASIILRVITPDWPTMTKTQRRNWYRQGGKKWLLLIQPSPLSTEGGGSGIKRSSVSRLYMETALEHEAAAGMGSGKQTESSSDLEVAPVVISVNRVGLVDSARETNKARAVAEIYLNRGRYPLGMHPFDNTNRKPGKYLHGSAHRGHHGAARGRRRSFSDSKLRMKLGCQWP